LEHLPAAKPEKTGVGEKIIFDGSGYRRLPNEK
jgi:hypothetical protein